jgi:hypothetical protein
MNFFEKLTDGLHLYEVVILVLGSVMFLALVAILIIFSAQRRSLKQLFMFFAVPVLMLVWPSIQKIKISDTGAEIEKQIAQVEENPSAENKESLKASIKFLEKRDIKDPEVRKRLIKAHYLLGNNKAAEETIKTLPPADAADTRIRDIKTSINVSDKLKSQLELVNKNPEDSNKIKELNKIRSEASQLKVKNEELTVRIDTAQKRIVNYGKTNPNVIIKPN